MYLPRHTHSPPLGPGHQCGHSRPPARDARTDFKMHRQLLSQPANLHGRNCAVPHGWPSCTPPKGLQLRGSEWGVAPHLCCVHQPGKPGERGSQERAHSSNGSIQKEEAVLKRTISTHDKNAMFTSAGWRALATPLCASTAWAHLISKSILPSPGAKIGPHPEPLTIPTLSLFLILLP